MKRGELAKRTGCNIETVRFYEKEGLLEDPPRTAAGHRIYDDNALKRLLFIRRTKELGFTLDQTRSLLLLSDDNDYTCSDVQIIAIDHIEEVKRKIADLEKIKSVLIEMASKCGGSKVPDCPIIEELYAS